MNGDIGDNGEITGVCDCLCTVQFLRCYQHQLMLAADGDVTVAADPGNSRSDTLARPRRRSRRRPRKTYCRVGGARRASGGPPADGPPTTERRLIALRPAAVRWLLMLRSDSVQAWPVLTPLVNSATRPLRRRYTNQNSTTTAETHPPPTALYEAHRRV